MNIQWEFVADCLRQELADYGDLLRLFEAQQRSLFARQPVTVLQFSSEIEVQTKQIIVSRTRREGCQAPGVVLPAESVRKGPTTRRRGCALAAARSGPAVHGQASRSTCSTSSGPRRKSKASRSARMWPASVVPVSGTMPTSRANRKTTLAAVRSTVLNIRRSWADSGSSLVA